MATLVSSPDTTNSFFFVPLELTYLLPSVGDTTFYSLPSLSGSVLDLTGSLPGRVGSTSFTPLGSFRPMGECVTSDGFILPYTFSPWVVFASPGSDFVSFGLQGFYTSVPLVFVFRFVVHIRGQGSVTIFCFFSP